VTSLEFHVLLTDTVASSSSVSVFPFHGSATSPVGERDKITMNMRERKKFGNVMWVSILEYQNQSVTEARSL
jgi:hypothetical protein